jgi:hypothetical protein
MELFQAKKIAEVRDMSAKTCRCGETLELVRTIVDSDTGHITHMFECPCGERLWDE